MKWSIDKLKYIFPNRPFGKTHKENRNARLVDINSVIEDLNSILEEVETDIDSAGASSFEELTDVPAYSGNQLKALRINAAETALETYIASDTDSNSWGMNQVAFVSPYASFGTGAVGFANTQTSADTPNTAFRTVAEANASGANLIFLLPGNHGSVDATSRTYYAFPGADIYRLRDGGASAVQMKLLGHARITYGIELTGSFNKFDIECDRFESRFFVNNSLSTTQNFVTIKANKMNQLYTWGGGFAVRTGNDSEVTIECNEMELLYWLIGTRSYNCTYTVRCPK
jgi:hypothetical protein